VANAIKAKGQNFAKFLSTLSPEDIAERNELCSRNSKAEYLRFVEHFRRDSCYLCEQPLSLLNKKFPCPHWLLKPKGFEKNDLLAVTKVYGYYQIQSFLRWVANQNGFGRNINELPDEGTQSKLFEVTIKHKTIEWAFSCAESDYQGHATSPHHNYPHYHFQMRIDRRSFINYSDFHIPFSDNDILLIEAMRGNPKIKQRFSYGEGINDLLSDEKLDEIVNSTVVESTEEAALFSIDSLIFAEEGKTISGSDIFKKIQEAKSQGATAASLLRKLPNSKTEIIVSPGPGVVEQAPRSSRK
jgi:hypothetical protein